MTPIAVSNLTSWYDILTGTNTISLVHANFHDRIPIAKQPHLLSNTVKYLNIACEVTLFRRRYGDAIAVFPEQFVVIMKIARSMCAAHAHASQ